MVTFEGMVIAYPEDRPPCLVPEPCNYQGTLWGYANATSEEARQAVKVCQKEWPSWSVDPDLERLARK
jgi:delta 1-pyrroline-5-carboxylate dehydrogenase